MNNLIVPALLAGLLALAAVPAAQAAQVNEKQKCLQELKDARVNLSKTEDTGKPGEKIEKEAKDLFPVVETLCTAGKYEEAAQLTMFLRHLLAD